MPREATPLPSRLKARARSDPISVVSRYISYPPATPSHSQRQNIDTPSPVRSHRTKARVALQEKLPYFLWQEDPDLSGLDTPRAKVVVADRIKKVLQDLAGDPPPLPDPCHEGHPLTAEVCIGSRDYTKAGSYMTKVCVFFVDFVFALLMTRSALAEIYQKTALSESVTTIFFLKKPSSIMTC